MPVLRLEHVHKQFNKLTVIKDLSLSVSENSVFGFIGPNGAGKTTTMKMILGFLKPSSGNIYVCGEEVRYGNTRTNRFIGYLPDIPEFYSYMRPQEYLKLCGEISLLSPKQIKDKTNELLHLVGLADVNRKIKGFSRGMKQRLGIAQALLNDPTLLICDEPTSALDPIGRKQILDILSVVKERTTVVFSTHILADVERICDSIGVLHKGQLLLKGNLEEVKSSYQHETVELEVDSSEQATALVDEIRKLSGIVQVDVNQNVVAITTNNLVTTSSEILRLILAKGIVMHRYEILEPTLENLFLELIR